MNDENPNPNQYPLGEPSVLDYVKSLFHSGNGKVVDIPSVAETVQEQPSDLNPPASIPFPWRSLVALGFALIAQSTFEPPQPGAGPGLVLYLFAFAFLGWAVYRREWTLPALAPTSEGTDPATVRLVPFIASILLFVLAFLLLGGSRLIAGVSLPDSLHLVDNQFTWLNLLFWILATGSLLWALWLKRNDPRSPKPLLQFNAWTVLFIAATMLIFFFRFYQTVSVPPEPFSDHAEKLLDVYDVSQGQTHIFFTRNTGREAFQMYWTLFIAKFFGTGLSYLSLKLGTAILGLLTLPYIYLLGKEIGGVRVGFIALLLAGIGYWPNVISRVGLRFPLYPLFTAPTLFYLLRGLRTRNRNDFILS
ncbi:MAG TPA: hypothetical protein VKP08_21585, partial [Anaerolineales bacterium]|nr:hypothetical protein [Anaerolineales bacterium]